MYKKRPRESRDVKIKQDYSCRKKESLEMQKEKETIILDRGVQGILKEKEIMRVEIKSQEVQKKRDHTCRKKGSQEMQKEKDTMCVEITGPRNV